MESHMSSKDPLPGIVQSTAQQIVDAAIKVHIALGPGLLESVYETCLEHELGLRSLAVDRQVGVPISYEGIRLEGGLRLDLLINKCVVVEIKAVEAIHPVHSAQLLSYLKLSEHRLGLLINFNVPLLKEGIRRIAN
jgi:GxxExxY protein